MTPPLHLPYRTLHPDDCTSVSFLAFELSVKNKQASPTMGLAFHFAYIIVQDTVHFPCDKYVKSSFTLDLIFYIYENSEKLVSIFLCPKSKMAA